MRIPGANVLNLALGAVSGQRVGYRAWVGRAKNPAGKFVDAYAPRVIITASIQPVSRDRVMALGLDLSKSYVTVYTSVPVRPVAQDRGADLVDYKGRTYSASDKTDWGGQDGWADVVLVDVGAYP